MINSTLSYIPFSGLHSTQGSPIPRTKGSYTCARPGPDSPDWPDGPDCPDGRRIVWTDAGLSGRTPLDGQN